jgi:beta-galactosidase
MNEYCHAMGNSLGNISEYWEFIYQHEMFAGGFVWDWIDQALWKDPSDISKGFVYGVDFGDMPNNDNFCINGIIGADLQPHPHYQELQKVYQPFSFKLLNKDPLTLEVKNRNLSLDALDYDFSYLLMEDGLVTRERALPPLTCAPTGKVRIQIDDLEYQKSREAHITFRFALKEDCEWAEKGHIIAWEQFKLADPSLEQEASSPSGEIQLHNGTEHYSISGSDFMAVIDKSTGLLLKFEMDGREIITDAVRFNFWRALTDNDWGWEVDGKMGVWKEESGNFTLEHIEIDSLDNRKITLTSHYLFNGTSSTGEVSHTFYPDGKIVFDIHLEIPDDAPNVPRIGMQIGMNKNLDELEWYGRGPHENYVDRKTSAAVGIHRSNGNYVGVPKGDSTIYPGDVLILYGQAESLRLLDQRRTGGEGDRDHDEAVGDEQRRMARQNREELEFERQKKGSA